MPLNALSTSLRAICADPAMPAKATVCRWLARNAEFRGQYALARELQAERFADEMLAIADHCSDLSVARRRIGAVKLVAARLTPRKYGKS
jgi:Bacteriophage Sf6, terminase small subunit-like